MVSATAPALGLSLKESRISGLIFLPKSTHFSNSEITMRRRASSSIPSSGKARGDSSLKAACQQPSASSVTRSVPARKRPSTSILTAPPGSFSICLISATTPTLNNWEGSGSSNSDFICETINIFFPRRIAAFTAFRDLALAISRFMTIPGKITVPRNGINGST